jgi:aldose 1-epimerase
VTKANGDRYPIGSDGYVAEVTEVGASLRLLRYDERDLVAPFPDDAMRPVYRGTVLAPWPNRVADGRYTFGGTTHQLPVNEVDRMNALHGLVAWSSWRLVEHTSEQVVLTHRIHPRAGYPFLLDLQVSYRLEAGGLTWQMRAVNCGHEPAPYGCAHHPYLVAGQGGVDDWSLHLPAEQYLEVTPDRLLPVGVGPVRGTELDFRTARRVGPTEVDHAFTGLVRDAEGSTQATLTDGSGSGVAMRWGAELPWVQVHTADRPEPELHRSGLAVEPMTCPPDAFNSGQDLVRLAPGETHSASWTLAAIR